MPTPAQDTARALYDAGVRGNDLLTLTAIGLAENAGQLSNLSTGQGVGKAGEVGPWQIHPIHFGTGAGQITPEAANSYAGGANFAAFLTYQTPQGLNHWSTFTDQSWKQYAKDAGVAMQSLPSDAYSGPSKFTDIFGGSGSSQTAIDGASQGGATINTAAKLAGLDAIGDFFNNLRKPSTLWKGALTLAGVGLIVGGIVVYFHAPIEHAAEAAGKAA